ncbi:unknown protein [Simkania negevensis Z]|uniref:Uncharacterized protein n=1 Tax=Simkania negevensis (strain ATCC VR-1471 / DSM 27360 / Z) TaxID=331113 RepID=F8L3N0_SIMNZ|nr:unknown protein [Simkania negevensis Z]
MFSRFRGNPSLYTQTTSKIGFEERESIQNS